MKTVLAKKPPAAVKSACVNALKHAGRARSGSRTRPNRRPTTTKRASIATRIFPRDARDEPLKKESAAAWVETPAKYKAAFAPADKIASPKKKRAKSTTPTNAKPPPPAATASTAPS